MSLDVTIFEVRAEPWTRDAACHGLAAHADDLFFPNRGESTSAAKDVCGACPVAEECLDYALRLNIRHGIWGGKSERERRVMRRVRNTDAAA